MTDFCPFCVIFTPRTSKYASIKCPDRQIQVCDDIQVSFVDAGHLLEFSAIEIGLINGRDERIFGRRDVRVRKKGGPP